MSIEIIPNQDLSYSFKFTINVYMKLKGKSFPSSQGISECVPTIKECERNAEGTR